MSLFEYAVTAMVVCLCIGVVFAAIGIYLDRSFFDE